MATESTDSAETAAATDSETPKRTRKRTTTKKTTEKKAETTAAASGSTGQEAQSASGSAPTSTGTSGALMVTFQAPPPAVTFQAPEASEERSKSRRERSSGSDDKAGRTEKSSKDDRADKADRSEKKDKSQKVDKPDKASRQDETSEDTSGDGDEGSGSSRRRRRRRRPGSGDGTDGSEGQESKTEKSGADDADRKAGDDAKDDTEGADEGSDDSSRSKSGSSVRVRQRSGRTKREAREPESTGSSTRLEAKRQRRKEGREAGRRRPAVLTEAEFLARREAVDRVMVVRSQEDRIQIGVLEDDVLVEHYASRTESTAMVGNVYLGKVQNVLPSMEAAFVDIGRGRNAVLYAGEVNWDAAGLDGQPKRIESALAPGDSVLVQVTKEPMGHKGARLTSQISMPGRFLVLVPNNPMTGISRKLPDTERSRLRKILKRIVPEKSGVIVRTAAEGATEEELEHDINRLAKQWEEIETKSKTATAPSLLYSEPDLAIRVVRDIFNEDVKELVVAGSYAWETIEEYVKSVSPDLAERLTHWVEPEDIFAKYRVEEQLVKALDRKVWLPSGGSLVIDRTEAMTVVDVNTGRFVGQGGNLEETVTKNNLEAAEEIVRQLRLRDIGGIIVIDFIDMVLETNRDQVLRRLVECLGRDRTKHQVAEVTSLGLVQMTRKRIGQGLLEVFSHTCEVCKGRGVVVSTDLAEHEKHSGGGSKRTGRSQDSDGNESRRSKRASRRQKQQDQSEKTESNAGDDTDSEAESHTPHLVVATPPGQATPGNFVPPATEDTPTAESASADV